MTRKDYVAIAQALNKALQRAQTEDSRKTIEDLATIFIQIASEDNPRFDEEIFRAVVFSKDLYKLNNTER